MARKGENIYKRKDGRWEGRYIKSRSSTGKANYGYVYAKSYREVKAKLISQSSCTSNSVTVDPEISSDQFEQVAMEWFQAIFSFHMVAYHSFTIINRRENDTRIISRVLATIESANKN